MTIKVFESILPVEPAEVYDDHGMTVEAWIQSKASDYKRGEQQPVSCAINGEIVKPADWPERVIGADDVVEFRVVPLGGAVGDFFGSALGFIANPMAYYFVKGYEAVSDWIMPNIPDSRGGGQQGSRIESADAKANVARLGQGVPELLGRYIRYPDYLNQPRSYYKNPRTQVQNIMLAVTVGECTIESSTVQLGETPLSQLGDAVSYEIFPPGADVSSHPAHENWYSSPEVGSTTGGSGIKLSYGEALSSGLLGVKVSYSGSGVKTTSASVYFPGDWAVGDFIAVTQRQSVTISVDGSGLVTLTGDWGDADVGDQLRFRSTELSEANGIFTIDTKAGNDITISASGVPANGWPAGSKLVYTRREDEEFRIDSIVYDVTYPELVDGYNVSRYVGGSTDSGWAGFGGGTGYADVLLAGRSEADGWIGPFVACPYGEVASEIEVDIFLPQGQGIIDDGKVKPFGYNQQIEIQWREYGESAWSSQVHTIDNATRDQLGFTFPVTLGAPFRPEVRVRRTHSESTKLEHLNRFEWQALRAKLPTVTSYPGVTTMAVTITGTDKISTASNNKINLVATRKLPTISGGALSAPATTRTISAAVAYVAKSLGYDDDQIDLDALEQLEAIWTPRGDFFDYVISDGTAKDALETILRAGMASMTIDTGAIKPVRDQVRTQFEDGYSPENMTAPLTRTFEARQVDESDGVEVEYTDAETWTTETVLCALPGDQQIKLDKVKLNGVTDRTRAWRIGMRRRRAQKYRRWTYSFNTELDALNSEYLSYVPLLDDVPGYGKVAILEGIEADRITVSEAMEFEAGKSHVVAYRAENGETIGPFPCTQGPDEYTLLAEIPQPWPAVLPADREPTHVYFGTTERWNFPALITDISPQGPASVGVEAVNYDPRVYADDDRQPD